MINDVKKLIRDIDNFPKEGVTFKDITPVLSDKDAFKFVIDKMAEIIKDKKIDLIVGPESRGFIFGCPLAYKLGIGFVPARKPSKLPSDHISETYDTEYGEATLSIHSDSLKPGQRVLLIDDLLATGGTINASSKLVERLGGEVVGALFLIEIMSLNGRKNIKKINHQSLITYE